MYRRMTQGIMKNEAGEYVKDDVDYIMRTSDKAMIPCVEENPDYQQYLNDLKAKATVTDFDYEAEEQRQAVESAQATAEQEREALIQAKIREMAIVELTKEGKIGDII
jgi:hypothetical protein